MHQLLFLDGGVLVNVFFSGEARDILTAYPATCVTTKEVLGELVPPIDHPDTLITLAEALQGCPISTHIIDIAGLEARFLDWASEVPGNIARVLTFAEHGSHTLACDDVRVRMSVEVLKSGLALLSTEDLLFNWHRRARPTADRVVAAVAAVEQNAYYAPLGDAPAATWWREIAQQRQQ